MNGRTMKPGAAWGSPAAGPPDLEVAGGDHALAAAHRQNPQARIRFVPAPGSDLARALGLRLDHRDHDATAATVDLQLDTFVVETGDEGPGPPTDELGVNLVGSGSGPWARPTRQHRQRCVVEVDGRPWFEGSASAVIVASGQYRSGWDLVPRGHPGDGRLEVQVYAVPRNQRLELRRRLRSGTHLPHPDIQTTSGREILVRWRRSRTLEIDGERRPRARHVRISVRPGTLTLVI